MFSKFTIDQFLQSNFHIGHSVNLRDKKYNQYLMFAREKVDIINTIYSLPLLRRLLFMLTNISYKRKKILFVSENASILSFFVVKKFIGHPFIGIHWRPGVLSNFKLTSMMLSKIIVRKGSKDHYSNFLRHKKIANYFAGIMNMRRVPDFAFFCTAAASTIGILEAKILRIPTGGVIDTNGSPYAVSYPIFGNDDSFYGLTFILNSIFESIEYGAAHRALYFLQRILAKVIWIHNSKYFSSTFSKILKFVSTSKDNEITEENKEKVDRVCNKVKNFLILFVFFFKDIIRAPRKASFFTRALLLFNYFLKMSRARVLLLSTMQKGKYNIENHYLLFLFLLYKIDVYCRRSLFSFESIGS